MFRVAGPQQVTEKQKSDDQSGQSEAGGAEGFARVHAGGFGLAVETACHPYGARGVEHEGNEQEYEVGHGGAVPRWWVVG